MVEDVSLPLISVVIPTYRPGPQLADVVGRVSRALELVDAEIILVDDGNDAAGAAGIRAAARALQCCRVLRLEHNQGQQRATLAGLLTAGGRFVVTMDDDGGHPPELLPRMLAALGHRPANAAAPPQPGTPRTSAVDLVYGVPERLSASRKRALGSRVNRWIFRVFLGVPRCAPVTSFRAFRAALLSPLLLRQTHPALPGSAFSPNVSAMLLSLSPRVRCISFEPPNSHLTRHSPLSLVRALTVLALYWAPRGLLTRALGKRVWRGRALDGPVPQRLTLQFRRLPEWPE